MPRSGSGSSAIFASTSFSPSAWSARGPRRVSLFNSWARSCIAARSSSMNPLDFLWVAVVFLRTFGSSSSPSKRCCLGAHLRFHQSAPRSQARRNVIPSLSFTLVQVYGQRRDQDPWRRENGQGEGRSVADGDEADGRQGCEHHGETGSVEPGPAPVSFGGEPRCDRQVRRDQQESAGAARGVLDCPMPGGVYHLRRG